MKTTSVTVKRVLPAPPERVFAAWSDAALLARWFIVETGWVAKAKNDLRVGGAYRIEMHRPDGTVFVAFGEYLELDPPRRLAFTWSSAEPLVQKSIVRIEAPVGRVWAALADLTGVQHYNPTVASSKCISENPEGIGAARRCELRPDGWVEERVWEWSPERALGLEVSASTWPIVFMRWKTELRPDGAATFVTQQLDYRLKLGPLGALLDLLVMRRKLDASVAAVFAGLKAWVEAQPLTSSSAP